MLRLIVCEFAKLKRRRFVLLVILASFLFPIPLTLYLGSGQHAGEYDSKIRLFDDLFTFVIGYGVTLLLPCVLGVLAAMLFFSERDNDTFKNLRTIPVTSTQMIFAKIMVLFFLGILFCLSSTVAAILCGSWIAEVGGIAHKLFLAVEMGIFVTAGTLPLVILVVFFSKTYIFSVLLCVFYSVLSMTAESCFGVLPKLICWLMPIPLITLWSAGDMLRHGMRDSVKGLDDLIPSTFQTVLILGVMAILSVALIDYLYKKRGDE